MDLGMKCVNPTETGPAPTAIGCNVRLPMGILGFEQMKENLLIANPEEEPFRWLQVKDNPSPATSGRVPLRDWR